jgi:hypothetical protein
MTLAPETLLFHPCCEMKGEGDRMPIHAASQSHRATLLSRELECRRMGGGGETSLLVWGEGEAFRGGPGDRSCAAAAAICSSSKALADLLPGWHGGCVRVLRGEERWDESLSWHCCCCFCCCCCCC